MACTRSLCGIFEALCGDNNHRVINYTFVNISVDFVLVSRSQQCWERKAENESSDDFLMSSDPVRFRDCVIVTCRLNCEHNAFDRCNKHLTLSLLCLPHRHLKNEQ